MLGEKEKKSLLKHVYLLSRSKQTSIINIYVCIYYMLISTEILLKF